MSKDNLIELKNPEPFVDDQITAIIRHGARKFLAQALEAEIELFTDSVKLFTNDCVIVFTD